MEQSSRKASGRTATGLTQQRRCPMCDTGLTRRSGTDICLTCNWVKRFPAD